MADDWDALAHTKRPLAAGEGKTFTAETISDDTPPTERNKMMHDCLVAYMRAKEEHETIKAVFENARDELMALFPPKLGTIVQNVEGYTVEIARSETLRWDTDTLRDLTEAYTEVEGAGDLPEGIVKQTLSIPKKVWENADDELRDKLRPALTIGLSSPKIKVTHGV